MVDDFLVRPQGRRNQGDTMCHEQQGPVVGLYLILEIIAGGEYGDVTFRYNAVNRLFTPSQGGLRMIRDGYQLDIPEFLFLEHPGDGLEGAPVCAAADPACLEPPADGANVPGPLGGRPALDRIRDVDDLLRPMKAIILRQILRRANNGIAQVRDPILRPKVADP